MKILFLVNQLLNVCGITKHFYYLLKGLLNYYPEHEYYVIYGGGDAIEKFHDLGVQLIKNESIKHESRNLQGYIKGIWDIRKFTLQNKIDVIHSHHHYAASLASKAVKFTKTKTILTNHGLLQKIGLLDHFSADYIIAVNQHVVNYLIENNIKKKNRVFLINHGFPYFEFKKETNKKLKIIAGGRLVNDKGFDIYIRAISLLSRAAREKAIFYIAGDGPETETLKKLNDKFNANIIFLRTIVDFDVFLRKTDVFVMTSRSKSEGLPTVLIEAALGKNLIISSKFLGYNSILSKDNSLLFEVEDYRTLALLLEKAINKYNSCEYLINNLNMFVKTQFSLVKMVDKTIELYKGII